MFACRFASSFARSSCSSHFFRSHARDRSSLPTMASNGTTLLLRSETKPLEHRSALTPTTTKALIDAGYTVKVERSPVRIFDDAEFEAVGAQLIPEGSWVDAPAEEIIVGLKELEEKDFALKHTHVQFAHCYKGQAGWDKVLARYARGNGTLLDLEFLEKNGRRVAAFGYWAGFAGAALSIKLWAWQQIHGAGKPFPPVESYPNEAALLADVKKAYAEGQAASGGKVPQVLVIGALGRCGSGAVDLCTRAGLPADKVLRWDMAETKPGGPFREVVESDIFVNCIYLSTKIPPFVTLEALQSPDRKLSVVCDVSADSTNPLTPVPIYTITTTFDKPTVAVEGLPAGSAPLDVISIDHLPSLLPREASDTFSHDLLPYLLTLNDWRSDPVWAGAEKLYKTKVATLPANALA